MAIVIPANIRFHCDAAPPEVLRATIPAMSGVCFGIPIVNIDGIRYSFHEPWNESIPIVAKMGFNSGAMMFINISAENTANIAFLPAKFPRAKTYPQTDESIRHTITLKSV